MEKSEVGHLVKLETSSKRGEWRVSTPVERFDGVVEGGFPQGSMILLAGARAPTPRKSMQKKPSVNESKFSRVLVPNTSQNRIGRSDVDGVSVVVDD